MSEIINATCNICGNESSYDKQSLKGSTWVINGCKVVLCCPCEDDLLVKIAKGRGIKIKLGDGGEVDSLKWNGLRQPNIKQIEKEGLLNQLMSLDKERVMDLIGGYD